MKTKYIIVLLLVVGIIATCFVTCYIFNRTLFEKEPLREDFDSLNDLYSYAEKFLSDRIDMTSYQLYEIKCSWDSNFLGETALAYTKRTGLFRDVYFVVVDTKENTIGIKQQSESNRIYGGNYTVAIESWAFDKTLLHKYADGLQYNRIEWQTIRGEIISIKYFYDDILCRSVSLNPTTNEVIR